MGADGSGQLAEGDALSRSGEPFRVAPHLVEPHSQLEPEGDGLGVDTVGAADHQRVFVLSGTPAQGTYQVVDLLREQVRGVGELQAGRGVPHVACGEPEV